MNICTHCGFTGEPEEFTRPTGGVCKDCYNKRRRERRKNNHEKIIKQEQEHRENNREKTNEYMRNYREKNHEKVNKQRSEYLKKNREKINKQRRKNRKKNREELNKKGREYREKNREELNKRRCENRENNREEFNRKAREYYENNKERINKNNKERYYKNDEYNRQRRKIYYHKNRKKMLEINRKSRRKRGILPWTEIKKLRFGLYIEKAVASMFGSIAEEYNNRFIDFVCPQGYKMQVKASSMIHSRSYPCWAFHINKNTVVDYFILVAVNNADDIDKEDFKPVQIWMMEGNVVNNKDVVRIYPNKLSKWDEYSILDKYGNKLTQCCTTIKHSDMKVI